MQAVRSGAAAAEEVLRGEAWVQVGFPGLAGPVAACLAGPQPIDAIT